MRLILLGLMALAILASTVPERDAADAALPGTNGKIAFQSDRDGNSEIYVMNADGTAQTRITNNPAWDGPPVWSPDGSKIAFASNRDGNFEVYVMKADGTAVTRLTHNSAGSPGAWSPDGTTIAFTSGKNGGNYEIFAINSDGTGEVNLTNNPYYLDLSPAWSPDGRYIGFTSLQREAGSGIYIMNADGSGATRTSTLSGLLDFGPKWSPDGSKIVFTGVVQSSDKSDVYTVNVGSTGLKRITNDGASAGAVWSPDGRRILYSSSSSGNAEVYSAFTDGSDVQRLTSNSATDSVPDWQALPPVLCTVGSVVDGDTFTCTNGTTVDMLQIDAQEIGQCGGGSAKAALENIFLTPGRVVRLDFDRTQVVGATTLAAPVARGTDGADYNISIVMVYVGLAKAATIGTSNTRYLDWANASQVWAQAAHWNMWAPGKTYTGGCD